MKRFVIALFLIVAVAVGGLQLFLAYGLTDIVRRQVVPGLKEQFNLDVDVDRVSVNLLAGDVTLHGFQVANPEGFGDERMIRVRRSSIAVSLPALLKGKKVDILRARAKDGQVQVVRNSEGHVNVRDAGRALLDVSAAPVRPWAAPDEEAARPDPEPREIGDFRIRDVDARFQVQYDDHTLLARPMALCIDVDLRMNNIANHGPPDILSGTVAAHGRIVENGNSGSFKLQGIVSPVIDPERISFTASIRIEDVRLMALKEFVEEQGLIHDSASGRLNLKCDRGIFDPEKSELRLTFHDIGFTERLRKRMMGLERLESFTIVAPVRGSLAAPDLDIKGAIRESMLSDEMAAIVLKSIMEQQDGPALDLMKDMDSDADEIRKGTGRIRGGSLDQIIREIRRGPGR